jgi:nucleoside-diphosphate-sugar epimerase
MSENEPLNVILGAGPVGRALAVLLHGAGRRVRVVTRSGMADVPAGVEVVKADVAIEAEAVRACEGAAVVYGCVGMGYKNWPKQWPRLMRGMLKGAEAAGARFIFMDNVYMYGPVDGPMHEGLPLTGYGRKPAVRAAITRMWQQAHAEGRLQAAAVRASDFYGPGVTVSALGEISFGNIAKGKPAQCLGDATQKHSYAYVPDIARALQAVGEGLDAVLGQAWHAPHAAAITTHEVLQLFAGDLHKELKIAALPDWTLRVIGLFDGDIRELYEMLYQWRRPFVVDDARFVKRFGIKATPLPKGIRKTAIWYRDHA